MIGNGFDEISLHASNGENGASRKPGEEEAWNEARPYGSQHDEKLSLEAALNKIGFGRFQFKVILSCGLFLGVDAMEIMLLSFVGPALECDWQISSNEKSILPFTVFLGAFLGSYVWGTIADVKGRKPVIRVVTFGVFVLGILSAFAPSYAFLAVCRTGIGFFTGGTNVVVSYCIEMLPTAKRGKYGIFIESFWTVGTLLQVVLAWVIFSNATSRGSWRTLVGWSSLPALICFVATLPLPESPRYLLSIGQAERAYDVVYQASAENGHLLPVSGKLSGGSSGGGVQVQSSALWHGCIHGLKGFRFMFGSKFRMTSILLLVIWFVNALAYYGVVLLGAAFAQAEDEEEIGSRCNNETLVPFQRGEDFVDFFVDTISEFPGVILAAILISRMNRKPLGALFFLIAGGSLATLAIFGITEQLSVATLFFARMSINASFITTYVYTPEVYPTAFRTTAFGACLSFSRIGGMVAPFVVESFVRINGGVSIVAILSLSTFAGSVAFMLLPFETRGVALDENAVSIH